MIEPTCSPRDAASVIVNLPDCHVIDAVPSWLKIFPRASVDLVEGGSEIVWPDSCHLLVLWWVV